MQIVGLVEAGSPRRLLKETKDFTIDELEYPLIHQTKP